MTTPYQSAPRAAQPGEHVGPIKAIGNYVRRGFQFSGRASRSEYWWIALYSFVLGGAIEYAQQQNQHLLEDGGLLDTVAGLVISLVLLVVAVLVAIFSIALSVRRLHDSNLSGWWFLLILLPVFGQFALLILAMLPPDPHGVRFDSQPQHAPIPVSEA